MIGPIEARIQILSRPSLLAVARHTVEAWCDLAGAEPAMSSRIALAVDEAMTNVIRHGYQGDRDGIIDISMQRDGSTIGFIIEDRAVQVPIQHIKGRALDDIRPGGLGVHLIREVMDEAVWSHRDGGGMRLELKKDLIAAAAAEGKLMEAGDEC